jgi:prevent-host-death family protein
MSKTVAAEEFEASCLALLDEVAASGDEVVITKDGKEVARLVPSQEFPPGWGRLRGTVKIHGDIFSTGEKWEADS